MAGRPVLLSVTLAATLVVSACAHETGSHPTAKIEHKSAPEPAAGELDRVLDVLRVTEARSLASGAGVTIAIVDSGVDADIPALRGRVLPGYDATRSMVGADSDKGVHGTAMAGLAAGAHRKGGTQGVAPDATILPVRIIDNDVVTSAETVERGLRWLVRAQPDVVLLAYTPQRWTDGVITALAALRDGGAVVVLSAGNAGAASAEPPLDGILVAASIKGARLQSYSAPATIEGIVTPGGDADPTGQRLIAPAPGGAAQTVGGTSASAAIVAGAVALARSSRVSASASEIIDCIRTTAIDLGPAGPDHTFGAGKLDAHGALSCVGARRSGLTSSHG